MNTLILGMATREEYADAIVRYVDPEDAHLFTFAEYISQDFEEAAADYGLDIKIAPNDDPSFLIQLVIVFTSFIGIDAVRVLEESHKEKATVIFIHPK